MNETGSSNPSVPSFGEELRKERELRNISLKEIADATKISKRFLEAIERNDLNTLPAAVFTRGFVREYARYLGLNTDEMVTRYGLFLHEHEMATQAKEAAQMESWSAAATARPLRPLPKPVAIEPPRSKALPFGIAVISLILLGAAAFYFFRQDRAPDTGREETSSSSVQTAPSTATTPEVPASDEGLLLQLKVNDDSWITLLVDDKQVFNDEMKAGDEKSYEAKDSVTFKTIGNAGGIDITLNGTRVPPLGESGDVIRNRKFDRNSLEQLSQNRSE